MNRIVKKLLMTLVVVAICSFLFVGCTLLDGVTDPDPDVPELVMEAVVTAELNVAKTKVLWSIVNVGDVFIREYVLTFDVYYPIKDNVILEVTGNYLEVGEFHEDKLTLFGYDTNSPEAVSVSWELFD